MREVLPEQWSLAVPSEREDARALLAADGAGFVAKNVLRPRTGSGKVQDRLASGGMLIADPDALRALLEDEDACQRYILYRRERLHTHDSRVALDGAVHELAGEAVSEVATFGAFVADASGATLRNELAGFGVRTRPASSAHALAPLLGYGALSGCKVDAEPGRRGVRTAQ